MSALIEARAAGFTHVLTAGGPVSLDDWRPYDHAPDDVRAVTFHFRAPDKISEEPSAACRPMDGFFYLGLWTLSTGGVA